MDEQQAAARRELDKLPGAKEAELAALGPCRVCGRPLLGKPMGTPLFYRVTVERLGWDMATLSRRVGLEMVLGGSGPLARAMGPDEDLAKIIAGPNTCAVHEECAGRISHLMELFSCE